MGSKAKDKDTTRQILAISDVIVPYIYSPRVQEHFNDIDLLISCGDLPNYYLEYVVSTLNVPLVYVHGNHDHMVDFNKDIQLSGPGGGTNLHRKTIREKDLIIAGVEGSLRYREGPFQYDQGEMWQHVFSLIPRLILNRLLYGRYLDLFITHSPPVGIHDKPDLPHQGIRAFRWLLNTFRPKLHIHGHTHIYRPDETKETQFNDTLVINAYGYCKQSIRI